MAARELSTLDWQWAAKRMIRRIKVINMRRSKMPGQPLYGKEAEIDALEIARIYAEEMSDPQNMHTPPTDRVVFTRTRYLSCTIVGENTECVIEELPKAIRRTLVIPTATMGFMVKDLLAKGILKGI